MRTKFRLSTRALPVVAGATIFFAAILFGWWRRDFGVFLLGLFGFPVLLFFSLVCFVVAARTGRNRGTIAVGALLIVAAPLGENEAVQLRDPIRFAFWKAAQRSELDQLRARDGIIMEWDDWGMAGGENFSYLIVDTRDASGTLQAADHWRKRMRLECPIVAAQRMAPRLYIVTTDECVFAGVPLPSYAPATP